MPKLGITNDNMFSKVTTGGDYNRPLGVLKDVLVIVSAGQAASRIVPTSFKYLMGVHELEVYVNGVYKRRNEGIDLIVYGDYSEYTNFSVFFNVGVISVGDRVRFRVTSANYKITNVAAAGSSIDPSLFAQLQIDVATLNGEYAALLNNVQQDARDVFGFNYAFSGSSGGSTRTIGDITDGDTTPDLRNYRTWKTWNSSPTTITNFLNCRADDVRYIIATDDNTTIQDNAFIILPNGVDLTLSSGDVVQIIYDGIQWLLSSGKGGGGGSGKRVDQQINPIDWILDSGSGNYYYDVDISTIATKDIQPICFDDVTNDVISPLEAQAIDISNFRIWMPNNTMTLRTVLMG